MEIYTIGFAGKSALQFFGGLKDAGIRQLVDVRLNNKSQLAGFTKADNLPYFLKELCDISYRHEPLLVPTKELLDAVHSKAIDWAEYERRFVALLDERRVADTLDKAIFAERSVLLCSEAKPDQCHRRVAAEYLRDCWGDIQIIHL